MTFGDAAIADLKGRMPCHEIAGKWVKLRKAGDAWVGPCPICSRDRAKGGTSKFKAIGERWMCAACVDGGDVIELVRRVEGKSFSEAVEWLGGVQEVDAAEAARRQAIREAKAAEQEKAAAEFRARERGTLYEMWKRGLKKDALKDSSLESYLALRGLAGAPTGALRCIEAMPYYDSGKRDASIMHRGPAMLAAYQRPRAPGLPGSRQEYEFAGLHITYLDLAQPNGKLKLATADGEDFAPKKMRGSKTGAVITLARPDAGIPRRAFIGEGIETVLSVWCAMSTMARLHDDDAFYCAGDLGNLGGKAARSVPHPFLKDAAGRTRRVPGPTPAPDTPSIVLPDTVTEVIILGDGDSDAFTTGCALARAQARFEMPGRRVVVAMAPDGSDYNDVWRISRDAAAVCALIDAAAPLVPEELMATATAPARDSAPNSAAPHAGGEADVDSSSTLSGKVDSSADPPPWDDFPASPSASAAAAPSLRSESQKPSRMGRPGTRSANRARWGGPPRKYGEGAEALDRWLAFFPMTELGLIERFVQRQKHRLKYCEAIGWLLWNKTSWTRIGALGAAISAGHEVVRAIQDEAESIRDTEFDEVVALKPGKKKDDEPTEVWLSDLLEQFGRASETKAKMTLHEHAEPYLAVEVDQLDADPFMINVLNGTLVVRREWLTPLPAAWRQVNAHIRLKPHEQADLITKIMPVRFDADAECPRYDKFLEVVQPSDAMRDFLDDWNGYSLTGDVSEQKLVFHYGTGKNGKSTELAVRMALAGDYGKTIPIETFVNEGRARAAGQASPDLAMLRRVRALAASEPEKGWKLNEALIKTLTGGDEVPVRELHRPYFMLRPEFKLSVFGNFKPNIGGGEAESGIWRRVVLVLWGVKISKAIADPHLVDKLKLESSGILNRWLAGLARWIRRGMVLPDEVAKATEQFRIDSDPLGRFLADCTEADSDGRVQSIALYNLFVAWARANGEVGRHDWTATGFGRAMSERGYVRVKSNLMYWINLKLTKSINDFVDHEGKPLQGGDGGARAASSMVEDDDVPV
jgi:putative DNA primase/helicase